MVTDRLATIAAPLFVPATRLDRAAKAAASGADAVILDLEDAVAADEKVAARAALSGLAPLPVPVILRVNGAATAWHADDLAAAASLGIAAIMVPKAEAPETLTKAHRACGLPVFGLVETARGLAELPSLARAEGLTRLVFGSVDFCADVGCEHAPEALLFARSQIIIASRVAELAAPIDGVTLAIDDEEAITADARRAVSLGFGGKLCIHPRQVSPVMRGFAPTQTELAWSEKVLSASAEGAAAVDGIMVDAPVRRRAEQIRQRAMKAGTRTS